jgi:ribosome biogenesis GTPase
MWTTEPNPRLAAIGCKPWVLQRLALIDDTAEPTHPEAKEESADPDGSPAALHRVTEVQRDALTLHDGRTEHPARALPALLESLAGQADALAVGDWVIAHRDAWGQWWVRRRVPPRSQLARRHHDGRDKVTRGVVASNVDTVLLVMGATEDFNLRRLERYATFARLAGVGLGLVLTKADLCTPAELEAQLEAARAVLARGTPVVAIDATAPDAARRLRAPLGPLFAAGETLVLMGSSGAGKSTLTNALVAAGAGERAGEGEGEGEATAALGPQATGGNRSGDGRGRHTTTARTLFPIAGGACVIDTPGLRTLRLDADAEAVNAAFDDIAELAMGCRFRDCTHRSEPRCAVRDGVPAARLLNFQKMSREARRDTITALERRAEQARWKLKARHGEAVARARRGG